MTTTSNSKFSSKDSKKESSSSKDKEKNKENQQQQQQANKTNADDNEADKHVRFENEGVVFKAKLIGSELVMEPRGGKMCQNSIQRLKAIIKGTNSHKKRVILKISYNGVKVYDEKTNEILHHHEVSQISYIASDDTDNRTFGYVGDVPNNAHQFICFKTSGPAINVMSVISALFEAVLEKKNQAESSDKLIDDKIEPAQEAIDLIGDSGIMDGDISISSDTKHVQSSSKKQQDISMASSSNSFSNQGRSKQSASSDLLFDDIFSGLSDPIIVDKNDSLISYKPGVNNISLHDDAFNVRAPSTQRPTMGSASMRAIPRGHLQNHILLPPPSSLPRPTAMPSHHQAHNRSLVYNHSSVSLSDAALTRQSSYTLTGLNDSYTDRYAVFNDIDNLPSIFESTSLGSVNNVGARNTSTSKPAPSMFRQTNPFDDDFFA